MVSIDKVYQTVLVFANSDVRGNIKPRDIRLAVNDTVTEIYEGYFTDISRAINRQNKGLTGSGIENIRDRLSERLQHFLVEDVELTFDTPYWTLPVDYRYIDIVTCDGNEVELYKSSREFKIVTNCSDTTPNADNPIGLKIDRKLRISPSDADSVVKLSYLRNPVMANWTFTIVSGAEILNPSSTSFRDIDLHQGEEHNVIFKTLYRLGINLKEQDIVAITQGQQAQEFNQDNIT